MSVLIIDSGSGNLAAIENSLRKLKISFFRSDDPSLFDEFTHFILPGVGSFDTVMNNIINKNLVAPLKDQILNKKKKILGICVGMQILANASEEGELPGLGFINGHVIKFKAENKLTLPHMGWNSIISEKDHNLLKNIDFKKGFYFLHSFYFECKNPENKIAETNYDSNFSSIVGNDNILGVQFHPEKSHQNGINIFKNFSQL